MKNLQKTAPPTRTFAALTQHLQAMWLATDMDDIGMRRIQRMRLIACGALLVLGMLWGAFFAVQSNWLIAALCGALVPCALGVLVLAYQQRHNAANLLVFGVSIVVVCALTLLLDAPTAQSQRSIHLFLLPLAASTLLAFRNNHAWIRYGVMGLSLLLFMLLTGSDWAPVADYQLPESVRAIGKWLNAFAAVGLLLGVLHVLHTDATQQSGMQQELETALREQQFVLYFQPQLDPQQRVTSAEVLIRWQHPQRGLMPPGFFIDHAERNGLMVPLGQWILEEACAQLQRWSRDPLLSQLELAVNVSQAQFRQPTFAADVLAAVNRCRIRPELLELELTETLMVLDMDDLHAKMQLLQAQGIRFSLDDFGTGFSSLSHLRQLPLHTLKIDRSFVKDLPDDANSKTIVRSLLGLSQSMELTVVAEGIETPAQYNFLAEHGCPRFQGYLFSKPLPLHEFEAFVRKHNTPPAPQTQAATQEKVEYA